MDGARIWNALTASGKEAHEVAQYVDSLSVCLSKGLGCPIGSLLVGPREFIEKARRIRKALGGGMRQVGIVAAAGLIALDDFVNGILLHDHIHTSSIAKSVANMRSFRLMTSIVETNILFLEVADAAVVGNFLKARNIVVSVWSPTLIRIVLHRDIDEVLTNYIIEMLHECNAFLVD
jgi:threonine aldolase